MLEVHIQKHLHVQPSELRNMDMDALLYEWAKLSWLLEAERISMKNLQDTKK
jgi:hypothetical protein